IAVEHMTPVILLTDAFIGNGSSAWRIPTADEYPAIRVPYVSPEALNAGWRPYDRDENTKVRSWAIPGTEGATHRLGGLEKDYVTGAISTDPVNHEKMVQTRREKIARIADDIPALEVMGDADADTLLIGWGGTFGHLITATNHLNGEGVPTALVHFRYINPLPANALDVIRRYKRVIVAELNTGMFADYLQSKLPGVEIHRINKIQGQPFQVSEVVEKVKGIIAQ
ncbi:MAG: 2-oxoacid:acceptor oxidoreductase subunit alpha, partial [Muribaculaceae bacterium]|nr:2-oxoacid:acceptor oxidoreductase subunit alpha [Muribaculaceae bacterium]